MAIKFSRVEFKYPPKSEIYNGFDARDEVTALSNYGWGFDSLAENDLEFLKQIKDYHNEYEEPAMIQLFNKLWISHEGCFIGENHYSWEEIQPILMDEEEGVTTLLVYVRDLRKNIKVEV